MSLPDEILDELLSGHLDGVLSGDECARVEQLLRDDPSVRSRFEQLGKRRELLLQAALPVPRLPKDFSESVLQAAIQTAQSEQLSSKHPLMLAAKLQSGTGRAPVRLESTKWFSGPGSAVRVAGLIGGLAASLMVAGFLLTRDSNSGNGNSINALAGLDSASTAPITPSTDVAPAVPSTSEAIVQVEGEVANNIDQDEAVGSASKTLLAESDSGGIEGGFSGDPTVIETAMDASDSNSLASPADSDPLIANDSATKGLDAVSPAVQMQRSDPAMPQLAALMVIEVRLSEVGRVVGAFDKALETVAIENRDSQVVSNTVASAAELSLGQPAGDESASDESGNNAEDQDNRLVLLEAPVKKLDLLVKELFSDTEGVEAIGFSMISDAIILRGVESSRELDPTTVRHEGQQRYEGQSWPVTGEAEQAFAQWADQGDGRGFIPLPKGMGIGQLGASSNAGPNPTANLLILVR